MIGLIKDELKYVTIKISAHGVPFAPRKETNPIYKEWEKLVE